MNIFSLSIDQKTGNHLLFTTTIVILFLFFIDEGYYNFNWMLNWGSWVVFLIYLIVLFPVQLLISAFMFKKYVGWKKILLVSLVGIPLGYLLILGIF